MNRDHPSPPRWTNRVLRVWLPRARREEVMADLDERFRDRLRSRGRSRAARWYRRQAASLVLWGWSERAGDAGGALRRGFTGGWRLDVRVAARSLVANPTYALVAVVTLALGIGGSTAVFSVVDAVLLAPLPFSEPDELVAIHETRVGNSWWSAAPVNAFAWRARSRTLQDVAWGQPQAVSLNVPSGDPVPLRAAAVSANMFALLGVEPVLGRAFVEGDDARDAPPVLLLTHGTWTDRFAADPGVIGRRIDVDGVPRTVVGVLPEGGEPAFLGMHDVVLPRPFTESEIQTRGRIIQAIGRLSDDVSIPAAAREMASLGARLDAEAPAGVLRGWGVRLVPLKDQVVGSVGSTLLLLLGSVGFVLLVACANLGNLMLARGSARARDLAVRASLGADRARLIRHLFLESVLIGIGGAALGLLLATWSTRALLAIDTTALPRALPAMPDGRVLAFTGATSLFALLVFGLGPALRVTGTRRAGALLHSGRGDHRGDSRLRSALVATEVALVAVLLVGAGMMVRSLQALNAVQPGFQTEGRIAMRFNLPASRYPDSETMGRFVFDLVERVRTVPGVVAAGTVSTLPLSGGPGYTSMQVVRSLPPPESGQEPLGGMEIVSPGYFETMGIPLLAGRDYRRSDADDGLPRIIVDEAMVRRDWPEADPLVDGLRMAPPAAGPVAAWRDVIGVVGAVHYGLDTAPRPRMYLQETQIPFTLRPRTLVVRAAAGRETTVIEGVRQAFTAADPLLPIERVELLGEVARSSIARPRLQGTLLGVFAAIALALGAVGVYGVVAYAVARRTREVGVRLAVGASRSQVLVAVMRSALIPVVLGLAVGLGGAAALSGLVSTIAFGVQPMDPVAFVGAPVGLLGVATVSALLPGLRATRIDPVRALRAD